VAAMFVSPITAAVMKSVPPKDRRVGFGMRATLQNVGQTASLAVFLTIVLGALGASLPGAISTALTNAGATQLIPAFKNVSPTSALFAAFLGYNPVQTILNSLPTSVSSSIPGATKTLLTGNTFFPNAIAPAFISALRIAFYIGAILSGIAAVTSALRGSAKPVTAKPVEPRLESARTTMPTARSTPAQMAADNPPSSSGQAGESPK